MRTPEGFEVLLERMESVIKQLSNYHCSIDPEGAAQEARMRLYTRVYLLKRVDCSKSSNTVRLFLQILCQRAMINEREKLERKGMNCKYRMSPETSRVHRAGKSPPKSTRDFANDRPEVLSLDAANLK